MSSRAWLLLALLAASCTCRSSKPIEPPRGEGAYFDRDPQHPWNRVFHALFDRQREVGFPTPDGGTIARRIELGVDEPQAFIGEDVTFLRSEERTVAALAALEAALVPEPSKNPIGAALLQSDLWERLDALEQAIAERDEGAAQFARLVPAISKLRKRLALSRAQVKELPSNESYLATAFPALMPGFPDWRFGWSELRKERPLADGGVQAFTHHSERWGNRVVFRIFTRVPLPIGGAEWFDVPQRGRVRAPENTLLVLLASPLVETTEGELMAVPFFTLLEHRVVRVDALPARTIGELPFAVLEATRAELTSRPWSNTGAFHRLAADVPVPMGATCLPDLSARVPLASSCLGCHADGAQLGGAFIGEGEFVSREREPTAAAAEAIKRRYERAPH